MSTTDSTGADLILEWCSLKGSGTRRSFDDSCRSVLGASVNPAHLLHEFELCGHVEVDWVHSGRWWITPPVLSFVEGSGGNAVLLGARSHETIAALERLEASGDIDALTFVSQGPSSPTAVFVGTTSVAALTAASLAIGASAKTTVRLEYKDALVPLEQALVGAVNEYTSSGIQARRLNVVTLRFEPCEVRFGSWPPGGYEQMSYGLRRYLYVDNQGLLHNVDRWVAVHAEINRARGSVGGVMNPVSWSPASESLFCDARAQLPIMWARAAIMCTGLLPVRHVDAVDGHFVDEYRGVIGTTYNRIRQTLGYEIQQALASEKVA
jgi:hypothetical protein